MPQWLPKYHPKQRNQHSHGCCMHNEKSYTSNGLTEGLDWSNDTLLVGFPNLTIMRTKPPPDPRCYALGHLIEQALKHYMGNPALKTRLQKFTSKYHND